MSLRSWEDKSTSIGLFSVLIETKYIQQLNSVFCSKLKSTRASGGVCFSPFNTQRVHKHFQLFKRPQLPTKRKTATSEDTV